MKTFIKLILLSCIYITEAKAQILIPTVNFTYNAAGLRTYRTILNPIPLVGNQTAENDSSAISRNDSLAETQKPVAPVNQLLTNGVSDVLLYPNPVVSVLKITAKDERLISGEVTVYEIMGRVVMKQKLTQQTNTIDLSDLQTAAYIIEITDNQQTKFLYRIIKQ